MDKYYQINEARREEVIGMIIIIDPRYFEVIPVEKIVKTTVWGESIMSTFDVRNTKDNEVVKITFW